MVVRVFGPRPRSLNSNSYCQEPSGIDLATCPPAGFAAIRNVCRISVCPDVKTGRARSNAAIAMNNVVNRDEFRMIRRYYAALGKNASRRLRNGRAVAYAVWLLAIRVGYFPLQQAV